MKHYWKEQPVTGFQHDNAQAHTFETVNQPHLFLFPKTEKVHNWASILIQAQH